MSGDMNNQIRTMMDLDLVKKEFSETTAKYRHRLLLCPAPAVFLRVQGSAGCTDQRA